MKIVLAPDSLKESISATEAVKCMEKGIRKVLPHAKIVSLPMADGGEGTVQTLVEATNGKLIEIDCHDPLMRKIKASYGILGNREEAVIELAAASGIHLLKKEERNPLKASSFGTGEILQDALQKGCRKILMGIGGSAIVDGGAGIVQALGISFLDKNGNILPPGGGNLEKLYKIDLKRFRKTDGVEIILACDVTNPLTGPNGASCIYGPQKGASMEMVKLLDRGLAHYAKMIKNNFNKDIEFLPGIGAGGGVGASLVSFLDAKISSGFSVISSMVGLEKEVSDADLIITAEGKVDGQTLSGKVPFGVGRLGKKYKVPVILLAGIVSEGSEKLLNEGISKIFSIAPEDVSLEDSIRNASFYLENSIEKIIQEHFHF